MDWIINSSKVDPTILSTSTHLYGKFECRKGHKMGHITIIADPDSKHRRRDQLICTPSSHAQVQIPRPPSLVGIIKGSDSNLPVMLPAARTLDHFHILYALTKLTP
ncbi:hypothetical protein FPV67DRAFT_1670370 [Lyophyllum atratum]|nr:hypothetical protein FPV67DRAFT_1670370 [Lyophyllum atratum]